MFDVGFDRDFRVVHSCIESKEGIDKIRGSEHTQSQIGDTFGQVKGLWREVGHSCMLLSMYR